MWVLRGGGLRGCFAVFMALLLIVIVVTPVKVLAAQGELRYEARLGDATFGNDLILNGMRQAVFHQQTFEGKANNQLNKTNSEVPKNTSQST
jgi:hypothetical protein